MTSEPTKVFVVYLGGFQPFHIGHMSSYRQGKDFALKLHNRYFPQINVYYFVLAGGTTIERPFFDFDKKKTLMLYSGLKEHEILMDNNVFMMNSIINYPLRNITVDGTNFDTFKGDYSLRFNKEKDIVITIRGDKENPSSSFCKEGFVNEDVDINTLKPLFKDKKNRNRYCFKTKVSPSSITIGGKNVISGTLVRDTYIKGNDATRIDIIRKLYSVTKDSDIDKIKSLFDEAFKIQLVTENLKAVSRKTNNRKKPY